MTRLTNAAPKPPKRKKKPRTPIRRSRVRQKAGKPKRFRARRDDAYLTWIRGHNCALWSDGWIVTSPPHPAGCGTLGERFRIEAAHVIPKARGADDRNNVVPLCPKHHDEQEGHTRAFEAKYDVNLKQIAIELTERYDRERSVG